MKKSFIGADDNESFHCNINLKEKSTDTDK